MDKELPGVIAVVNEFRRRWRRRALVQGAALCLGALAVAASLMITLGTWFGLPAGAANVGGVLLVLATAVLVYYVVVLPLRRRPSDAQVALFIEERIPELEDRFNSAVEAARAMPTDVEQRAVLRRLIDDAVLRARTITPRTLIDLRRERILTALAAAAVGVFLMTTYASLGRQDRVVSGAGLASLPFLPKPAMVVQPGDAEVEKGGSQEITALLRDDVGRDVVLYYRLGAGPWQKQPMSRGRVDPEYRFELHDLQQEVTYYVESGDLRSKHYSLSLYAFPTVEQIDVTYHFPAYTGRAPETIENVGDIEGLRGTAATITVRTSGASRRAELVRTEGGTLPLTAAGGGVFRGTLTLTDQDQYHIRLVDGRKKENRFPEEYLITPLDDQEPFITIEDPNQDVRANAVQEVPLAVLVQDDFGVRDVQLHFSINGAEEKVVRLLKPEDVRKAEVTGRHLFFLEDYGLEPGDVVSYYVAATDYLDRPTSAATDMYFIEVIPFDQRFTQVNNAGNMPGGGQPAAVVLNQQQIIAATWKLHRERQEMDPEAFASAREALVQAQRNLLENIRERLGSTAFSYELNTSEEGRKVAGYLRKAAEEMSSAVPLLEGAKLEEALAPERRALTNLLRADAMNKDRNVAINRQPGQGSASGGGSATEERMTELEDLELDISKDKYETQQSRAGGGRQPEVDEAMQRIRDLARRQQNLMNRANRNDVQGEDRKRQVERLQRDQEQLEQQARQMAQGLQRSSSGNSQESQQRSQQLERVSEHMRQAQQALREGNRQQAAARQQQALNELERLEKDLRLSGSGGDTREQLESLARRFDKLKNREQQMERDIQRASRDGKPGEQTLERLTRARQAAQDAREDLEQQADALAGSRRTTDRDLSTSARNLLNRMQRERLEERMDESERALETGRLDQAARVQEQIAGGIRGLESEMRELENRLPTTDDRQVARTLEDVRDLMRQLEQMQQGRGGSQRSQQSEQQGRNPSGQGQNAGQRSQQGEQQGRTPSGQGQNAGQGGDRPGSTGRRDLDQARETLERLQRDLADNPEARRALGPIAGYLGRADHTGVRLQGDEAKAFFDERAFAALLQLEIELSRQYDALAIDRKLYNARRGVVPPEYRALVDRYFETLSRRGNR